MDGWMDEAVPAGAHAICVRGVLRVCLVRWNAIAGTGMGRSACMPMPLPFGHDSWHALEHATVLLRCMRLSKARLSLQAFTRL